MKVWLEDDSELNPTKHYLLFPDEGGEVAAKIAQFLPNWMSPTPSGAFFNRRVTSKFCEPVQPLVIAGDLPEPPLGLNQLYIPLGAHRYSKMYALMYGNAKEGGKGWNVFYHNFRPTPKKYGTLKWFDSKKGRGGSYKGFFISRLIKLGEGFSRKDSSVVPDFNDYLALVELVDYRYHWQTTPMPFIESVDWDWENLGESLDDALKIDVGDESVKFSGFQAMLGYHVGKPDRQYLHRPGESAAIVAEASLRSFCQTYYPTPQLDLNWLDLQSDDVFAGFLPEKYYGNKNPSDGIEVHFQRKIDGKVTSRLGPYKLSFNENEVIGESNPRVVHSSAVAEFKLASDSLPTNYSDLYDIAKEINDFAVENWLATGAWQRMQERPKYFKLGSIFNSDLHDYAFFDFAAGGVFSREAIRPISTQIVSYAVDKQFPDCCGMVMIKAPVNGIPGRVGSKLGAAICEIVNRDEYDMLYMSGTLIKVLNWATSAVCAKGDRYGLADCIDGCYTIVAEDCNDEGTTTQPGTGGSTFNTVTDAVDTSTLTPASMVGESYEIRFSGTSTGGGFE